MTSHQNKACSNIIHNRIHSVSAVTLTERVQTLASRLLAARMLTCSPTGSSGGFCSRTGTEPRPHSLPDLHETERV
jgi:hypothetical protein